MEAAFDAFFFWPSTSPQGSFENVLSNSLVDLYGGGRLGQCAHLERSLGLAFAWRTAFVTDFTKTVRLIDRTCSLFEFREDLTMRLENEGRMDKHVFSPWTPCWRFALRRTDGLAEVRFPRC